MGYSPWGRKESDMTEQLHFHFLSRRSCRSSRNHSTSASSALLVRARLGINYCDIEWFALEMNRDHLAIFEIAPKNYISDSFVDYEGYSISSKEFLSTEVDIIVF